MRKASAKRLTVSSKPWLTRKRLILVAEVINPEKSIYRVYCPKCKTWHTTHLSEHLENEHFYLTCGEIMFV
ncbi:MAG: hypothetical protein QXK88_09805 [Desulfurococcaceae archaeon]